MNWFSGYVLELLFDWLWVQSLLRTKLIFLLANFGCMVLKGLRNPSCI